MLVSFFLKCFDIMDIALSIKCLDVQEPPFRMNGLNMPDGIFAEQDGGDRKHE